MTMEKEVRKEVRGECPESPAKTKRVVVGARAANGQPLYPPWEVVDELGIEPRT